MSKPKDDWKPDVATCREELGLFGVRLAEARAYEKDHPEAYGLSSYQAIADEALEWLIMLRTAEKQV